jgi:hypothetical protein
MKSMKRAVRVALAVFAAAPGAALAQWNGVPPPYPPSHAREGREGVAGPAMAGMLAPRDIVAGVRRAGFEPISRPVQRGRVYVLFAVDPYDVDVKLTVDAGSGRVLWVTDTIGPRYGRAGYYPPSRYERPPVPPGDIPYLGPGRNSSGPARSNASMRPSLPLPRTRPADLTSAAAKETPSPSPYASRTGAGQESGEPKAATPVRSDVAPAAKSPPVTMVPVAPLE